VLVLLATIRCLRFICLIWNGKHCIGTGIGYNFLVVTFLQQICNGYIRKIFECKEAELTVMWTESHVRGIFICMSCLTLFRWLYQVIIVCNMSRMHENGGYGNQSITLSVLRNVPNIVFGKAYSETQM
jgi:hypothetical protein